MWTLLAALALGSPAVAAEGMALELPAGADPHWQEAAAISGFSLGPCACPPCARLGEAGLVLWLAEGIREEISALGEPEIALALAHSRLTLGPVHPAEPEWAVGLAEAREPVWSPGVDPLGSVAAPVLAPPAPAAESRPRPAGHRVVHASVGVGDAPVFAARVGRARGAGEWSVGARLDGSVAVELGAGVELGRGRIAWRSAALAGVEYTPRNCLLCSVSELAGPGGATVTTARGIYVAQAEGSSWSPLVRIEAGPRVALGRTLALAPHVDGVISRRGLRPELGLGLFWQPR